MVLTSWSIRSSKAIKFQITRKPITITGRDAEANASPITLCRKRIRMDSPDWNREVNDFRRLPPTDGLRTVFCRQYRKVSGLQPIFFRACRVIALSPRREHEEQSGSCFLTRRPCRIPRWVFNTRSIHPRQGSSKIDRCKRSCPFHKNIAVVRMPERFLGTQPTRPPPVFRRSNAQTARESHKPGWSGEKGLRRLKIPFHVGGQGMNPMRGKDVRLATPLIFTPTNRPASRLAKPNGTVGFQA